jgi:hypothetical protein
MIFNESLGVIVPGIPAIVHYKKSRRFDTDWDEIPKKIVFLSADAIAP